MEQGTVSAVPERAKQGTEVRERKWWWTEASVWTERMVSALENGVRGGKWFSLVDKLTRPATLEAARGSGGPVSERTSDQSGGRQLSAATGEAGGDPEG